MLKSIYIFCALFSLPFSNRALAADFPTGNFRCEGSYAGGRRIETFQISAVKVGVDDLPFVKLGREYLNTELSYPSEEKKGIGAVVSYRYSNGQIQTNIVLPFLGGKNELIIFKADGSIEGISTSSICTKL